MPLARAKTWNPGDVLTAADLNAEFNNILNNPISLVSPTTGAINFQTSVAHTNLIPSAITASSASIQQGLIATSSGVTQWGTRKYQAFFSAATSGTPASTAETLLVSYTIPAGTIGTTGQGADCWVFGVTAATTNSKRVRAYLGGTSGSLLMDWGAGGIALNNKTWYARLYLNVSSSTAQVGAGDMGTNDTVLFPSQAIPRFTSTVVSSAANAVAITGENSTAPGAANDLSMQGFRVDLIV